MKSRPQVTQTKNAKPVYDAETLKGPSTPKQQNLIVSLLESQDYSPERLHKIEQTLKIPESQEKIYPDDWARQLTKSEAAKVISYLFEVKK